MIFFRQTTDNIFESELQSIELTFKYTQKQKNITNINVSGMSLNQSLILYANQPPISGKCFVFPNQGQSLITQFNITCNGYYATKSNMDLKYYFITHNNGIISNTPQYNHYNTIYGRIGNKQNIIAVIIDEFGGFNCKYMPINIINFNNNTLINNITLATNLLLQSIHTYLQSNNAIENVTFLNINNQTQQILKPETGINVGYMLSDFLNLVFKNNNNNNSSNNNEENEKALKLIVDTAILTINKLIQTTENNETLKILSQSDAQISSQISAMYSLINVSMIVNYDLGFQILNNANQTIKILNALEIILKSKYNNQSTLSNAESVPIDDNTAQNLVNAIDAIQFGSISVFGFCFFVCCFLVFVFCFLCDFYVRIYHGNLRV